MKRSALSGEDCYQLYKYLCLNNLTYVDQSKSEKQSILLDHLNKQE